MTPPFQFSFRVLLVVVTAALGCVQSERPLIDEKDSEVDVDLLGHWFVADDSTETPFIIQKKPGTENVLEVIDPVGVDCDEYELRLSRDGDSRYVCVICKEPGKDPVDWFFRYEFVGADKFRIYELDDEEMYDAVKTKELAGSAWTFFGRQVVISDGPAEFRAFLGEHGKKCFERADTLSFKRIKKPNVQ